MNNYPDYFPSHNNPVFLPLHEAEIIVEVECDACNEDMTDEVHLDGHQICSCCRDMANDEGETVQDLLDMVERYSSNRNC